MLYDQFLDKLVWISACTYCNQDSAFSSSNTFSVTYMYTIMVKIKHGSTDQSNTEALTNQTRKHWPIKHGSTDQSNRKLICVYIHTRIICYSCLIYGCVTKCVCVRVFDCFQEGSAVYRGDRWELAGTWFRVLYKFAS